MRGTSASLFGSDLLTSPSPKYREPRFEQDELGRPRWTLVDDMGCEHVFSDGARIRDARFSGWNLSGILLLDIELDTVAFSNSRLTNFELQQARIRRLVISGGEGGLVMKSSSIDDVKVEDLNDLEAVVRLFGCEVVNFLITSCKCGIDIARSTVAGLVIQRCEIAGRAASIRESTLQAPRIICCTFRAVRLFRANFIESEIAQCIFIECHWENVDMSLSQLSDVSLTKCRIHKLSLDVVVARAMKIFHTRALHVTSVFSDLFDLEVVDGIFAATFEHSQVRSLMLWNLKTHLTMNETQTIGLRLCDVIGVIGGVGTTWWAPVIRRSILRGNGTRGITLIRADCTNTKVINDFGVWTEET